MQRRISKQINVGGVLIGGGAPISVQSMCNTDTRDVKATVAQINALKEAGCEIVRLAIPDKKLIVFICIKNNFVVFLVVIKVTISTTELFRQDSINRSCTNISLNSNV